MKIPVKYLIFGAILVFVAPWIPDYLAYEIKFSGINNLYLHSLTTVGKSTWFTIYLAVIFFLFFIVTITSLTILNGVIIKALNKEIKRRAENNQLNATKKLNLTRIIIVVNGYNILIRIFHLAVLILFRINILHGIYYSPITNMLRQFDYTLIAISYCFPIFTYAYFDKSIRSQIKLHFEQYKYNINKF